MNRRDFTAGLSLTAALATLSASAAEAQAPPPARLQIGMLIYPDMILLDLVGPQTFFNIIGADVHLVWKDRQPVGTDVGVSVAATDTFETCPQALDVLFVPGGLKGSIAAMNDPAVLAFLKARGATARYVTSVCTGSLVLGAAGLLNGYAATSHWYVGDLLPLMGATLRKERVVEDRNRITGGGVTAGLDLALTIAARLTDVETARRAQLVLEYDPKPPFDAGSPEGAGPALTNDVLGRRAPVLTAAKEAAQQARARLAI